MYVSVVAIFMAEDGLIPEVIGSVGTVVETAGGAGSFLTGVMSVLAFVVSIVARVLKVTACVSLGQLSPNHKLLMSFAYYFGIYFLQQTLGSFYYVFLGLINRRLDQYYYGKTWEVTLISSLLYTVVFYAVTWYTMDKRLNLD